FPHLLTTGASWVPEYTWSVFFIGEELANVPLTIGPAVSSFTLIEVIHKLASIVFHVFLQPGFGIAVGNPVSQTKKVGATAMAFVVAPFTNIQIGFAVPVRATSFTDAHVPVTVVVGTVRATDHLLKLAITMELAVLEVALITISTNRSPELHHAVSILAVAINTLSAQLILIKHIGLTNGCRSHQHQ